MGKFPKPYFACIFCFFFSFLLPSWTYGENVESVLSRSNYSHEQKQSILAVFREAEREDIPEDLLIPRLEEGIAKRAPANRVATVLKQELESLEKARTIFLTLEKGRTLLRDRSSWVRGSIMLSAGTTEEELKTLAKLCLENERDFREVTLIYVSLLQWGLDSENSIKLLIAAAKSSIPDGELSGIRDILIKGRQLRIAPEELIERIVEGLPKVNNLETLEERILW